MRRALWFFHLLTILVTFSFLSGELLRSLAGVGLIARLTRGGVLWCGGRQRFANRDLFVSPTLTPPLSRVARLYSMGTHVIWIATFTWFAWFSSAAPFRMHEINIPGLFDGADIGRAELVHNLVWGGIYIALVALGTCVPLAVQMPSKACDRHFAARRGAEIFSHCHQCRLAGCRVCRPIMA